MTDSNRTIPKAPWRKSLVFRVIVLCAVLVLCLFGSVYIITQHYSREVVEEMESRTDEIANQVVLWLDRNPGTDLEKVRTDMQSMYEGVPLDVQPVDNAEEPLRVVAPHVVEGVHTMVATKTFMWGDQPLRLTAQFTLKPQTEILRAFKNRYMLALTLVFVAALGLMIYFIANSLRPLRELSLSCAQISAGRMQDVTVRGSAGEVLTLERTFNHMVASLREKDKIEANLRQAQRLSAIGNLAAGVAHDVRNPLNAIKLLSSHTRDLLGEENTAAATHLQTIQKEVNRLEDIVSGFLSLARERELQPEPNRVDALLEECLRLVRKDAEDRGIRLMSELRAGDVTLMLDPKQWIRAILNVLINAMEACPKGGRVRLYSRVTDSACEIEIRDDGPGLTPEAAERAFEPYFTTRSTGTGLGLPITRGVIEEHGGAIQLSSTPGRGCQVLITMPREGQAS